MTDIGRDYHRIERAIAWIEAHWGDRPDLDAMAAAAAMSPFHFQRTFTRWAGVSPKRFLGFLTVGHARRMLEDSASVLDTALDCGLSGPGRLHDLFVSFEAATPGDVKARGAGMEIGWGVHPSPFGAVLALATMRGLCGLAFLDHGGDPAPWLAGYRRRWPAARFAHDPAVTAPLAAAAFGGRPPPLVVSGTNFQIQVWQALLRVPAGGLVSYETLARAVGRAGCPRAIGNANAANPLAFLIPCHRVIRKSGAFNDYRWGTPRKLALLGHEAAARFGEEERDQSPSTSRIA